MERQCGVVLPNGQPCARSLTCKSHSMGAKRGVAGRSLPYDMLLAAYQKKNQARQQSKFSTSSRHWRYFSMLTKDPQQRLPWMPTPPSTTTTTRMPAPLTRTKSTTPS